MGTRLTAFVALSLLAFGVGSCVGKTCSLVGCLNGVKMKLPESVSTEGELLVTIEAEGNTFACAMSDGTYGDCVGISLATNTRLREVFLIEQTPKSLHLQIKSNGSVVLERDVDHIEYQHRYINGEDCDDEPCSNATVDL